MHVQYCQTRIIAVRLSDPCGLQQARRRLGYTEDELARVFHRYSKGARKGLLSGWIVWERCTVGGWDVGQQRVRLPGTEGYAALAEDDYPGYKLIDRDRLPVAIHMYWDGSAFRRNRRPACACNQGGENDTPR